jgi:hypothetical protein
MRRIGFETGLEGSNKDPQKFLEPKSRGVFFNKKEN